jgi:hypothetical protein
MTVFSNCLAGTPLLNMMSISRYDLPFISGRQKYAVMSVASAVPPQT